MKRNFEEIDRFVENIECACGNSNHILRIELIDLGYEEGVDLNFGVLFPHYKFFRRILQAIRYVFKLKWQYYGFFTTSLAVEDVDKMVTILHKYKEKVKGYQNRQNDMVNP